MALFTFISARLRCLRCGAESDAPFQTYLFRTDRDNNMREYRVGDSEVVDGLDDYFPLHPWDGHSPLVLGAGPRDCPHCHLAWQWARLVLDTSQGPNGMIGTIRSVDDLVPRTPPALDDVHHVECELAAISTFPNSPEIDEHKFRERWTSMPVAERCDAIANGFRAWCQDIAGVAPPPNQS